MEPTSIGIALVALKKLADESGVTAVVRQQAENLGQALYKKGLNKTLDKALDRLFKKPDVAALFEQAFRKVAPGNDGIDRQFLLAVLSDPVISRAIADSETGNPPRADLLVPLFGKILPGSDATANAETVMEGFYRAFGKNPDLMSRLQIETKFGVDEIRQGMRELKTGLLSRSQPGDQRPLFQVPTAPDKFVGRVRDLELLQKRLLQNGGIAPIVGVHGMGGIGKSTLANHFTHLPEVRQHFSAGILFQFCGDNPLDSIVSELGDKVGLALGDLPPERALTSLKSHFAQCRCLLILDDVRADDLEALLPGGHCSVMLTSRRRDLAMLAENDPIDLEIFTEKECLNLLREFLGQKLDGHDAEARELCKKLGYLPMAVSVAAGLLRDVARMSFARLLEKLSDPDSGGLSVLQHRQRNVEHLLQTALDALDSEAELLLCAMAVCAEEGFRFEWPLQVSELPEARAETALQTLLDRSLLRELDRDAERYQLHTLVRQVAQKRPPTTPLPPRHAEFAEQQFAEKLTNWRTLLDDLPEARQAILWGVDEKKEYPTFLLGYYGYELCRRTGRLQEALEFMQDYQQFSDQLDDRDRLQRSYGNQALILKAWGKLDEAMELHKKKENICIELGNKDSLQTCYGNQALILQAWGKLDEAMKLHKKQEQICIELGNKDSLQICYGNQALILQDWGQLDEAMKLHKKKEKICIELGNKDSLWRCLTNQATIFRDQKEYGQAIQLLEQVESICGELGSKEGLAYCYWNMATVLQAQKHTTQARERAAEALRLFTEIGMPVQIKAVQKLLESL